MFGPTLAAAALILLPALANAQAMPPGSKLLPAEPGSTEVASILEDYRSFRLEEDPIQAGLEGDRSALSRLPGVTEADDRRRKKRLEEFKTRLVQVQAGDLLEEDRVNVEFLSRIVSEALQELEYDSARIVFNSEGGPEEILAATMRAASLRSAADVEAYLMRIENASAYIRDMTENARRGIRTGFVQPRVVTEHTLGQLRKQAVMPPESDASYKPLLSLPQSIPPAEQERFRDRARTIITTKVRPAQQAFVAMMEKEYLPKSRQSLGASQLPNGRQYYSFLVRKFTTTDLTPDAIHEIGNEQVRLIRDQMDKEMKAAGWSGDLAGFIHFLRTDPRFYAKSREELYMRASTVAKEIDGRIPAFFGTPPRLTYNVVEVPREIEENYTTGRYNLGSLEAGIAGSFVINTSHLNQRPLYDLPDLAMHEGVPGHHLQIAIRQEAPTPWFRRNFQVDSYTEGWAHYAESLGTEMGIFKTPHERFGMLSAAMWRACRLVADTGIHWKGWSLQQARRCFYENSALAPHNIETELQRYIAWPGQALSYKIGELKIRALRNRAEEELGDGFDIRKFHDMILWGGDLPLDLLEKRALKWISEQVSAATGKT